MVFGVSKIDWGFEPSFPWSFESVASWISPKTNCETEPREWKSQLFMSRDFGRMFAMTSFKLGFIAEDMMVVLSKPVGFVSNALE